MFVESFDHYVCEGDTIECSAQGFTVVASVLRDNHHIDDDDSHNVDQDVNGCDDDQQAKLLAARDAWFCGEWFSCGVSLAVYKCGVCLSEYAASLWGIEANYPGGDNRYLAEVANELLDEAITEGKQVLAELTAEEV